MLIFVCLFLIVKLVRLLICRFYDTFQISPIFSIMKLLPYFFEMLLLLFLLLLQSNLFGRQRPWFHVDRVNTFSDLCNWWLDLTDFLHYWKDTSSSCEHTFRLLWSLIVIALCSSAASIMILSCSFIDF